VTCALRPQDVVDAHIADLCYDFPCGGERPGVVVLLQLGDRRLSFGESRSGLLPGIAKQEDVELIHSCPQLDATLSCGRRGRLRPAEQFKRRRHLARIERSGSECDQQRGQLGIAILQKVDRTPEQ
jgi:hypothetical protein